MNFQRALKRTKNADIVIEHEYKLAISIICVLLFGLVALLFSRVALLALSNAGGICLNRGEPS